MFTCLAHLGEFVHLEMALRNLYAGELLGSKEQTRVLSVRCWQAVQLSWLSFSVNAHQVWYDAKPIRTVRVKRDELWAG